MNAAREEEHALLAILGYVKSAQVQASELDLFKRALLSHGYQPQDLAPPWLLRYPVLLYLFEPLGEPLTPRQATLRGCLQIACQLVEATPQGGRQLTRRIGRVRAWLSLSALGLIGVGLLPVRFAFTRLKLI